MRKHIPIAARVAVAALLISCVLCGMMVPVFAERATGIEVPSTGEKPSATPYILGGVMLVCIIVIVLLFFPKKQRKQGPKADADSAGKDE